MRSRCCIVSIMEYILKINLDILLYECVNKKQRISNKSALDIINYHGELLNEQHVGITLLEHLRLHPFFWWGWFAWSLVFYVVTFVLIFLCFCFFLFLIDGVVSLTVPLVPEDTRSKIQACVQ